MIWGFSWSMPDWNIWRFVVGQQHRRGHCYTQCTSQSSDWIPSFKPAKVSSYVAMNNLEEMMKLLEAERMRADDTWMVSQKTKAMWTETQSGAPLLARAAALSATWIKLRGRGISPKWFQNNWGKSNWQCLELLRFSSIICFHAGSDWIHEESSRLGSRLFGVFCCFQAVK